MSELYYEDGQVQLYHGDAATVLQGLEPGSVNMCVTSPPYWGLRDYGMPGQLGMERSPEEYVSRLVDVFREVRRVLRNDGTLWLNIGDTYAADRGGSHQPAETLAGGRHGKTVAGKKVNRGRADSYSASRNARAFGLKHKDLVGIPWMVAIALRADGWWLRQDIIWSKPNPMPESVKDRCTKAHEYLFLLSKSERYYYDQGAIEEPAMGGAPGNTQPTKNGRAYSNGDAEQFRTAANSHLIGAREMRNKRSVWTIATQPFPDAHFAVFPPALVRPCILAGSREGDTVLDPFLGSGTTGMVGKQCGRRVVGIDLNREYLAMAKRRVGSQLALAGSPVASYGHSRCTCERGPRLDAETGACEECVTPKGHWNYCPLCGRVLRRGR